MTDKPEQSLAARIAALVPFVPNCVRNHDPVIHALRHIEDIEEYRRIIKSVDDYLVNVFDMRVCTNFHQLLEIIPNTSVDTEGIKRLLARINQPILLQLVVQAECSRLL